MRCLLRLLPVVFLVVTSGCATFADLPVRTGTIVESHASVRKAFKPSTTGAAVGAAIGGIAGHQIGKGNGKKVATALGVLLGVIAGSATGGSEEFVPTSLVVIRDDSTGEIFSESLEGRWQQGLKLRFSVTSANRVVLR